MAGQEQSGDSGCESHSWRTWLQKVGSEFLTVHFVITLIVLLFWIAALWRPINALPPTYAKLTEPDNTKAAEALAAISDSAVTISGLFTTILGMVLGYYFGQRGQEVAEAAREKAEQTEAEVAQDYDEDSDVLARRIERLENKKAIAEDALAQAITLLDDGIDIPDGSPLANFLSEDEVDEDATEDEDNEDEE